MTVDHGNFWVVVGTVAPVTIAADVILIGQSIPLMPHLGRRVGEKSFTSWLRQYHMWFIGADLAGCLAVIGIGLYALWNGDNASSSAWLATCLLFVVLIVLCVLAVCTATIRRRKPFTGEEPE
jgi:Na+/melibiose symporter-like transporter